MKKRSLYLLCSAAFGSCVKDSSYQYNNVYKDEISSLVISLSRDSIPADGSTLDTITCQILPKDSQDSLNLSSMNLTITTTAGTFTENNSQTYSLTPTYSLDSSGKRRVISVQAILQSSTKVDTAKLSFKFLSIEIDTAISFYRVYTSGMKLSAASLSIQPDFSAEDTIYVQLMRSPGTPTSGSPISLMAYDSTGLNPLGTWRVMNTKSNATGGAYFIFVLGDSTLNGRNYTGAEGSTERDRECFKQYTYDLFSNT